MPLYFLLHDASFFHQQMRPALGAAWRQRSFEPCRALCAAIAPAAMDFAQLYHTGSEEPLLLQVARRLPFDRDLWNLLVGEVLLYGATAVPEVPTVLETLRSMLTSSQVGPIVRTHPLHLMEQAHLGTHDLVFGGRFYRPEAAGYNDVGDVARLADYLEAIEPAHWTPADLAVLSEETEAAEELEYVRAVFPALQDLYRQAGGAGQVVICEML